MISNDNCWLLNMWISHTLSLLLDRWTYTSELEDTILQVAWRAPTSNLDTAYGAFKMLFKGKIHGDLCRKKSLINCNWKCLTEHVLIIMFQIGVRPPFFLEDLNSNPKIWVWKWQITSSNSAGKKALASRKPWTWICEPNPNDQGLQQMFLSHSEALRCKVLHPKILWHVIEPMINLAKSIHTVWIPKKNIPFWQYDWQFPSHSHHGALKRIRNGEEYDHYIQGWVIRKVNPKPNGLWKRVASGVSQTIVDCSHVRRKSWICLRWPLKYTSIYINIYLNNLYNIYI